VIVELIDALGVKPPQKIVTNCVGNFFLTPDTWDPAYPALVRIVKNGQSLAMSSHIGREGSCNQCHKDPISFDTPGHVYLFPSDQNPPAPDCPVSPIADIPGNRLPATSSGGP
jgi:hypothetical protein